MYITWYFQSNLKFLLTLVLPYLVDLYSHIFLRAYIVSSSVITKRHCLYFTRVILYNELVSCCLTLNVLETGKGFSYNKRIFHCCQFIEYILSLLFWVINFFISRQHSAYFFKMHYRLIRRVERHLWDRWVFFEQRYHIYLFNNLLIWMLLDYCSIFTHSYKILHTTLCDEDNKVTESR